MITQNQRDAILLADLLIRFVASADMFNAQTLAIARDEISRAKTGASDGEMKLLDAGIMYLAECATDF